MSDGGTRLADEPKEHSPREHKPAVGEEDGMQWMPGPWHVEGSNTGGWTVADDRNLFAICSRSDWPNRAEESAANARLIAAAPELADALGNTLKMLEAAYRQLGMWSADNERIVKARAALAKARGEQL